MKRRLEREGKWHGNEKRSKNENQGRDIRNFGTTRYRNIKKIQERNVRVNVPESESESAPAPIPEQNDPEEGTSTMAGKN